MPINFGHGVLSGQPLSAAIQVGRVHTINVTHPVVAGDSLALNAFFASAVVVHSITTDAAFRVSAYNQHSTGLVGEISAAANVNLTSLVETPSFGQVYHTAIMSGMIVSAGTPEVRTQIIADENSTLSAVTRNTSASTQDITITLTFEEVGSRIAPFGLTASTLLEEFTEMSTYG